VGGLAEGSGVTVAKSGETELPRARTRLAAINSAMRRAVGPSLFVVGISVLMVLAAGAGYVARGAEVDRLDQQLNDLTTSVADSNASVSAATERVVDLSAENQQLSSDLDAALDLNEEFSGRLASLESAVQSTTDLETSLEALVQERDQLREDLSSLTGAYDVLNDRFANLKTIESFGPNGNPLLFDEGTDAWVSQPVCTGSMEPTIGCDDLLVVYKPTVTDLDVGDIIIFQRPEANCGGFVPGEYLLHRITRVVSSPPDGLMFETKGDSNALADPCRVPVSRVTGKITAIVQNSRLANGGE
jgi:signal peptidase I